MNKIAVIHRNTQWLKLKNKIIHNDNIVIQYCNEIHYAEEPIFNCKTVFIGKCDQKFVNDWINKNTFPNIKQIYLLESHPCQPNLFNRFEHLNTTFYLSDTYHYYKRQWAKNLNHVMILSVSDMKKILYTYEEEEINVTHQ